MNEAAGIGRRGVGWPGTRLPRRQHIPGPPTAHCWGRSRGTSPSRLLTPTRQLRTVRAGANAQGPNLTHHFRAHSATPSVRGEWVTTEVNGRGTWELGEVLLHHEENSKASKIPACQWGHKGRQDRLSTRPDVQLPPAPNMWLLLLGKGQMRICWGFPGSLWKPPVTERTIQTGMTEDVTCSSGT